MGMYKGDAEIGYDNKDYEVTGKAVEYMQQKNNNIRDYLGTIQQFNYSAKMQAADRVNIDYTIKKDIYKSEQNG